MKSSPCFQGSVLKCVAIPLHLYLRQEIQRQNKFADGDFACVQCQRRYSTLERLREHYRGAKVIHPSCPACGRGFADHSELDEVGAILLCVRVSSYNDDAA